MNVKAELSCMQTSLKDPLKLKWKRGKDMPYNMSKSVQAVVIGDNVYVGGGYTRSVENRSTVMVYSLASGSWSRLPPQETQWFSMAAVNNQLVLVGGSTKISPNQVTGILAMWDEGSQSWTRPFPKMPTPRHLLSITFYQKWLVVAGGKTGRDSHSNKVEILDTLSGQWYEGSPIPSGCSEMSSAINGNMWYLSSGFNCLGSNKHVLSVNLDELISQALPQSTSNTSPPLPSPWQTLTDIPLTFSAVLVLNGALMTIGGIGSSAIHHYQPSSKSWVKVGDLPIQRYQCACTVLPNGEILAVGGITNIGSNRVDIGAIVL
jgi:hypothetical protein